MKLFVFFFVSFALQMNCKANEDLSEHWRIVDNFDNFYSTDLKCSDSMNCFAVGNLYSADGSAMRRTTDGGLSWKTFWADSSIFYFDSTGQPQYTYKSHRRIYSFACPSNNLWFAGFNLGRLWKSTNMGASWDSIDFNTKFSVKQLTFYDNNFGVFRLDTNIMITKDGGTTWEKINMPDTATYPNGIQLLSPGVIIVQAGRSVIGQTGSYVYKTTDYGKSWTNSLIPRGTNSLYFINENIGWAPGGYVIHHYDDTLPSHVHDHHGGWIYKTIDGGKIWEEKLNLYDTTSKLIEGFNYIKFSDNLHGTSVGIRNMVYGTTDGGETWKRESNDSLALISKFSIAKLEIVGKTKIITGLLAKIYKYFEDPLGITEGTQLASVGLIISPNPASDFIEISYPPLERWSGGVNIKIFNVFGQTVLSVGVQNLEPLRIDVSTLPPGIYFVRIGDRVNKFIKL